MTVTVRPRVRWTLRVLLPVALLLGAWEVWARYEIRRFEEVSAAYQAARKTIDSEAALTPVERDTVSPYRYYAAATELTDVQMTDPLQSAVENMRVAIATRQPVDAAAAREAMKKLDRSREVLRLIETGSSLPISGNNAIFTQLRSINALSRVLPVLSLRTLEAAANDDGEGAVRSLVMALRFAWALSLDPHSFVATEKAIYMPTLIADTAMVLQRTHPSDAALEELAAALSRTFRDNDVERVATTQAGTFYGEFAGNRNPLARHLGRLVMATSVAAIDVARQPWPERVTRMASLPAWRFPTFWDERYRFLTGANLRDLYSESATAHAEGVALVDAALVAVRVEQYRRRAGALPDSLMPLAMPPQDAVDPFTGRSLLYHRQDGRFVVYSVGRDLRDDGGSLERTKGAMPGRLGTTKDVGVSVSPTPR